MASRKPLNKNPPVPTSLMLVLAWGRGASHFLIPSNQIASLAALHHPSKGPVASDLDRVRRISHHSRPSTHLGLATEGGDASILNIVHPQARQRVCSHPALDMTCHGHGQNSSCERVSFEVASRQLLLQMPLLTRARGFWNWKCCLPLPLIVPDQAAAARTIPVLSD
jgi:hypothetical protein